MNNALVKDRLTNIETAAREDAAFDKIAKFKKGLYSVQDQTIPLGTEFLAHAAAWTKCWIKFADGKVADRKVYRVAMGRSHRNARTLTISIRTNGRKDWTASRAIPGFINICCRWKTVQLAKSLCL
jgi:hypothetical protein